MFKILNATGYDIDNHTLSFNGHEYKIKGFSDKLFDCRLKEEIEGLHDAYAAEHLLKVGKNLGLVSLEYGVKARAKYPDYKEYYKQQMMTGLKNAIAYDEDRLLLEEVAVKQMRSKNKGSVIDEASALTPIIKTRIAQLKKWYLTIAGTDYRPAMIDKPVEIAELPVDMLPVREAVKPAKKEVLMPNS